MDLIYCLKDGHQNQPVAFVIKQNNKWNYCCGICQYESDLPKKSFIAIKDLEKMNKEILNIIFSSGIVNQLQNSLSILKDWHNKFENLLLEIKCQLSENINYFSSLIEILNQRPEYFFSDQNQLQEVLNQREKINFTLQKKSIEQEQLQNDLESVYEILRSTQILSKTQSQIEVESKEKNQNQNQRDIDENSIKQEQQKTNNTQASPIKNTNKSQINVPNFDSNIQRNEEKNEKQSQIEIGKLTISDNEYYEGQLFKGMMHGKGKLVKKSASQECIYEGEFFENKKHGRGKETLIEIESLDLNSSIFKRVCKQKNQKKIELSGEYNNDKKVDVFTKITYNNDVIEKEIYQIYEQDVLTGEFQ